MRTRGLVCGLTLLLAVLVMTGCASSKGGSAGVVPQTEGTPTEGPPAAPTPAPAEEAEDAEPILNRLKWTTATEVDNFGFDVYRSTSEDGPFDRVTTQPLPGAGTVDEPQYYVFEDEEIDPTLDYYYYVESIAMDGTRERFSPIIKARAKKPAAHNGPEGSEAAP